MTKHCLSVAVLPGFCLVLAGALAAINTGCQTGTTDTAFVESFQEAIQWGNHHIVLVRVTDTKFVRMGFPQDRIENKGTVVRSYKGTWHTGEPVSFFQSLDYRLPKDRKPSCSPCMVYLLISEHTSDPILVEPGQEWPYKPEYEQVLDRMLPKPGQPVTIDTSFTAKIVSNPTVEAWEEHSDELLYLVQKGNPTAIAAAIRVIPKVQRSDCVFEEVDWLAWALYEQIDLDEMNVLSPDDQLILILLYDKLMPVDWEGTRDAYLTKHPQVKALWSKAKSGSP